MEEKKRGRGRPPKEKCFKTVKMRLDEDELNEFKTHVSNYSEAIRNFIKSENEKYRKQVYNEIENAIKEQAD